MNSHEAHHPRQSVEQAAVYVGLSVSYLNRARITGDGPVFLKLGRRVVYETRDLDAWLESRRRMSTSSDRLVPAGAN